MQKKFCGTLNGSNITIRNNKLNNVPKIFGLETNIINKMNDMVVKAKYSHIQNFIFKK